MSAKIYIVVCSPHEALHVNEYVATFVRSACCRVKDFTKH